MFRRSPHALLAALVVSWCAGSVAAAAAAPLDHASGAAHQIADAVAPVSEAPAPTPERSAPPAESAPVAAGTAAIASEFVVVRPGEPAVWAVPSAHPAVLESRYVDKGRNESSSYQPRRSQGGGNPWRPVTQLHAGFLDPDGPATAGFDMGFRGGHEINNVLQIGVGLDWRTKSGSATQALQSSVGPGGQAVSTQVQLSHFSSNLLPVLAYMQLSGPGKRITPYVGIAGSWQVLFLVADDYVTGERFEATYSGFGWQAWGGLGLRVSGRVKLVAEAFMNQATLGRDLYDPYYNLVVRETVSVDGIGARYGVSWGF